MGDLGGLIYIFLGSLSISFILTPLMRKIALKKNIMAVPGGRMIHAEPIPYLGGVAIYFAFLVGLGVAFCFYLKESVFLGLFHKLIGLIIGATLILILGLWDDIRDVRPLYKLFGQVIIALLLFSYGFRIKVVTNIFLGGEFHLPLYLSALVTVLWFVGMVNAVNLIDGLDGLAAGITVIASCALIFVSFFLDNYINIIILLALAGGCLGFLKYNFYPAKIFMGDAGSMFLGLVLGAVALLGSQHKAATAVALLTPISALFIPIADTFIAVVRRMVKKKSIFKADKDHLHHRLLIIGLNQRQIVIFLYMVTLYLGLFSFLFVLIPDKYALILLLLLALGLFMGIIVMRFVERKLRYLYRLESDSRN